MSAETLNKFIYEMQTVRNGCHLRIYHNYEGCLFDIEVVKLLVSCPVLLNIVDSHDDSFNEFYKRVMEAIDGQPIDHDLIKGLCLIYNLNDEIKQSLFELLDCPLFNPIDRFENHIIPFPRVTIGTITVWFYGMDLYNEMTVLPTKVAIFNNYDDLLEYVRFYHTGHDANCAKEGDMYSNAIPLFDNGLGIYHELPKEMSKWRFIAPFHEHHEMDLVFGLPSTGVYDGLAGLVRTFLGVKVRSDSQRVMSDIKRKGRNIAKRRRVPDMDELNSELNTMTLH